MTRMDKVALLYFTKFSLIGNLKLIVCALPVHGEASSQRNSGIVRVELGGSNGRAYAQNE